MERYAYIDCLRGFAIFVVVVGHCCEFALGCTYSLFNYMYYSFHMPLFMFISGLVAYKRSNYKFWTFFKQKFYRLLIPFFIVGGISCLARGITFNDFMFDLAKMGYWFLPVLFLILLLMFPAYKVSVVLNKDEVILKDVFYYSIPLLFAIACYLVLPSFLVQFFSIKFIIKLYPFVLMGMMFSKYPLIIRFFENDKSLLIFILLSIISFVYIYNIDGAISIVGYFFVPVIYLYFKNSNSIFFANKFKRLGGGDIADICPSLFYDTKY